MNRPETRPLLPQTTPMSQFSFAPPNMGVGDTKKSESELCAPLFAGADGAITDYVFVDEHNRHKRLKVMRACEGCRRRKIKCDAATTNSWPCAACVRLKLQCVPPTVNYNRTQMGSGSVSGHERVLDFADSSGDSGDESFMPMPRQMLQNVYQMQGHPEMMTTQAGYTSGMIAFSPSSYPDNVTSMPMSATAESFHSATSYQHHVGSTGSQHGEEAPSGHLSDVLGELKIDEKGMGKHYKGSLQSLADRRYSTLYLPAEKDAGRGTGLGRGRIQSPKRIDWPRYNGQDTA